MSLLLDPALVKTLSSLTPEQVTEAQILLTRQRADSGLPPGTPGWKLAPLIGSISKEDLEAMEEAINRDCQTMTDFDE